jgi:GntR family transcriptional regulator
MTPSEGDSATRLPLVVGGDGYVPLHQQLVHQIRHLITNRVLVENDKLPSVRRLARQLGINAGTVAVAYRQLHAEGLIESRRGRGTFVAELGDAAKRFAHRHNALQLAIERLFERADALGFDAASVHSGLVSQARRRRRMPFVVAMHTLRAAEKYARQVADELPGGMAAEPYCLTLEDLRRGGRAVLTAYATAHFTFTFASYVPTAEARLAELGIESEVVGITSQLTPAAAASLRALDPRASYCLVAEATGISIGLNVLARHSRLDLGRITLLTEHDPPDTLFAAAPDLYIHTFSAGPHLEELGIPEDRRLELRFSLSDEARLRVSELFSPTSAPTPVARGADIILDA